MTLIKKLQGGATIGFWRVPYFCSSLEIVDNHLVLNASLLGYYVFDKNEILSLEFYNQGFVKGIKINHNIESYNDDIYFWPIKNTQSILKEIEVLIANLEDKETIHNIDLSKENSGHLVIKKPILFLILFMFFLGFINDVILTEVQELSTYKVLNFSHGGGIIATSFTIVLSMGLLLSTRFRRLILIKYYNFEYLKPFIYFLLLITFFILILNTFW
jgi:hypothetical protein